MEAVLTYLYKQKNNEIRKTMLDNGRRNERRLVLVRWDILYYTEWECEEDFQYEEINGKLIEIQ